MIWCLQGALRSWVATIFGSSGVGAERSTKGSSDDPTRSGCVFPYFLLLFSLFPGLPPSFLISLPCGALFPCLTAIKYDVLCVKIGLVPFCTILFAVATQKNPFSHLENGKSFFCKRKLKTPFGTIVWNVKVHLHNNIYVVCYM